MKPTKLSFVLILLALGLSLSNASLAQNESKTPHPSSREVSLPVQKDSIAREKAVPKDQRGTEQMPLVIKGIPPEKTPEQTAEDRKERGEKTANDRKLTMFTKWQALFAGCLTVIAIFQLGLFWWQLRLLRETIKLTRDEFRASFCPRLIVRKISIHIDRGGSNSLAIDFDIVNIGGTRAAMTEISAKLWLPQAASFPRPIVSYGEPLRLQNYILESGMSYSGKHIATPEERDEYCLQLGFANGNPGRPIFHEGTDMFFLGYVRYLDELGRRFETAFLRKYDFHSQRFLIVDDPDYEYRN